MSLFRNGAVSHQSERLTGAIALAQPFPIKLTFVILVSIAVAVITFLFTAEYSRKDLMPSPINALAVLRVKLLELTVHLTRYNYQLLCKSLYIACEQN